MQDLVKALEAFRAEQKEGIPGEPAIMLREQDIFTAIYKGERLYFIRYDTLIGTFKDGRPISA